MVECRFLAGFDRVHLLPGQSIVVPFPVTGMSFAYGGSGDRAPGQREEWPSLTSAPGTWGLDVDGARAEVELL